MQTHWLVVKGTLYRQWSSLALQDHNKDFFLACDILSLLASSHCCFWYYSLYRDDLNSFSDFVLLMGPGRLFHSVTTRWLKKFFRNSNLGGWPLCRSPHSAVLVLCWFWSGRSNHVLLSTSSTSCSILWACTTVGPEPFSFSLILWFYGSHGCNFLGLILKFYSK